MNEETNEFESLCAEYLDGELSDPQRDELLRLLKDDPARVAELRRQLRVSDGLLRMTPIRTDDAFVSAMIGQSNGVDDGSFDGFPDRVMNRLRVVRFRGFSMMAAAAALVLAVPLILLRNDRDREEPTVAIGMMWRESSGGEGSNPAVVHVGQRFDFEEGIFKLELANGAVVAIEGPGKFEMRSEDLLWLELGRLNAWCPESAHGFRVETASATLTDLGTSFGVSTKADGSSEFLVLDGKVELSGASEKRLIEKGGALRASVSGGLSETKFVPDDYRRTWPVASGIRATSGEVAPAPPRTPEGLAALEDDSKVFVIPERRDVSLPDAVEVNMVEAGLFRANLAGVGSVFNLKPGAKVRSYLLRYNPVGVTVEGTEFKRFKGSVTFDRPVLGIILQSRLLNQSDSLFASVPAVVGDPNYPIMRGLETTTPNPPDQVMLSKDQHTVDVEFYAGESVDEIRVITSDD